MVVAIRLLVLYLEGSTMAIEGWLTGQAGRSKCLETVKYSRHWIELDDLKF